MTSSTSLLVRSAEPPVSLLEGVADLFERMGATIGPDRVAMLYQGTTPEAVQREWALGLAGFRGREFERGLQALRLRRYAPNLGEFALLCRPALDPEYAFWEAHAGLAARGRGELGRWSHPAVWRAACELSPEVRAGNYSACRKRWEMTLSREFAAGWGEPVPEPVKQIENSPTEVAMPSEVRKWMAGLNRKFSRSNFS